MDALLKKTTWKAGDASAQMKRKAVEDDDASALVSVENAEAAWKKRRDVHVARIMAKANEKAEVCAVYALV